MTFSVFLNDFAILKKMPGDAKVDLDFNFAIFMHLFTRAINPFGKESPETTELQSMKTQESKRFPSSRDVNCMTYVTQGECGYVIRPLYRENAR